MISANPEATAAFDCVSVTGKTVSLNARFLTSKEREKVRQIVDLRIEGKLPEDEGVLDAAREAIGIGIVGTTFDELREHFTDRELCLLAVRYPRVLDLTEIDLGKFTSRRKSSAGESVAAAAEPAATNPAT